MTKRISKLFSILLALCMIVSMVPVAAFAADVPSKLYLKPNSNWTQANARFAAYYFNDSTGSNTWALYGELVNEG